MAKHDPQPADRSKFKFFYVEGDFASGDIPTLAQALTAAVRNPGVVRRIAAPATQVENGAGTHETDSEIGMAVELDADLAIDDATPAATAPKGPARVRTYPKPSPVDMDMAGDGKSFKEFVAETKPQSHRDKYLVAAAWLHDFGKPKVEAITPDHVWTCYKAAGWNFDVKDPSQVLRDLKREGVGTIKDKKFCINHLGLSAVNEMKTSGS